MPQFVSTLVLDAVGEPRSVLARFAPYASVNASRRASRRDAVVLQLYGAEASIWADGDRVIAVAEADEAGALATLKHMIAYTAGDALGARAMRWTGDGAGSTALPQFREMRVADAWNLTPRMRRVRLSGGKLHRFAAGGHHLRLLIPPAGRPPVWPHVGPAAIPIWPGGPARLAVRTYTIRRIDPEAGHLDIDVILHDGRSPGGDWVREARVGDPVGIMGPGGVEPNLPAGFVLAGDETALPAIARILEEQPATAVGKVLIEVHDEAERQALLHPAGVDVRWLSRDGRPAGTTTLLSDVLERLAPDMVEDAFVWSASEFAAFKRLRRHCRRTLSLPRDRHAVTAYWRRGLAEDDGED